MPGIPELIKLQTGEAQRVATEPNLAQKQEVRMNEIDQKNLTPSVINEVGSLFNLKEKPGAVATGEGSATPAAGAARRAASLEASTIRTRDKRGVESDALVSFT